MIDKHIHVGIIGMGPVGMILAVKLKEAGCDVAICDVDKPRMQKVKQEGIFLENVFNSNTSFEKVFTSPKEMSGLSLDFLVFCLKSYHTPSAAEDAKVLISEKLTVVSGQNGIDIEEQLFPVFGKSRTLRMIINYAGNLTGPNKVKVTFFTPPNYIGSVDDSRTSAAVLFAQTLSGVGFATQHMNSAEIKKSAWEKTILNASLSALCGVSRLTMADAMADPNTFELIEKVINEGIEIAAAEKINFEANFKNKCLAYLKKAGDHFPSLAGDLMNNRQTEIDFLNNKFIHYGKLHNIKTPFNLAFTNLVKGISNKNIAIKKKTQAGDPGKIILEKGLIQKDKPASFYENNFFLGLDLGSAYIKITIVDKDGVPVFRNILPAVTRDKEELKNCLQAINSTFNIVKRCATGYGRKYFSGTDMMKTEINCAAAGVSHFFPGEKNIIDIGGEDIKITHCDKQNHISNFYMNDKCAAGTGAFLSEISERAGINISDMSSLAESSAFERELNSFCTVFAKTEIMNWVYDGMPANDICRGIYISIANKVAKMRLVHGIPVFLIGGVIAHHPYLTTVLGKKFNKGILTVENPQFIVSLGAALLALESFVDAPGKDQRKEKVNQ